MLYGNNRHLQFLGHSIVGDKRYAFIKSPADFSTEGSDADGVDDPEDIAHSTKEGPQGLMYLWSVLVSFPHPVLNTTVTVQMAEPDEFQAYLRERS